MKKLFLWLVMFVALMGLSLACTVNIDPQYLLLNNSNQSSSSIYPNLNVTGNSSTWGCYLYGDQNGSNGLGTYRQIQIDSGVTNDTNTNFSTWSLADARDYSWAIKCNSTEDVHGCWDGGGTDNDKVSASPESFTVDTVAPSIFNLYPIILLDGENVTEWLINADTDSHNTSLRIGFNVTDNNPAQCVLSIAYNLTHNRSMINSTWEILTYANATTFNFTYVNNSVGFVDNNTGYPWHVVCNDSAGNTAQASGTFKVDTVAPTAFGFNNSKLVWKTDGGVGIWANTTSTDYTPQIGWNLTKELNLHRYEINFYVNVFGNTTGVVQTNVTANSTNVINVSALLGDLTYVINITAYDLAGNRKEMEVMGYSYSTDSTNRALLSGWNIIGNVGNPFSLSKLLNLSGATTASIWNRTHEFQSHVSGGSYGGVDVLSGNPALIYLSSATTFSDLVWNTSALDLSINLTNQSASDWNLVMNRNSTTEFKFQRLDTYLNGNSSPANQVAVDLNMTFMSFYDNSASAGSKYVPFVGNWSINNGTTLGFGQCVWLYTDTTSGTVEHENITLDWRSLCKHNAFDMGYCQR